MPTCCFAIYFFFIKLTYSSENNFVGNFVSTCFVWHWVFRVFYFSQEPYKHGVLMFSSSMSIKSIRFAAWIYNYLKLSRQTGTCKVDRFLRCCLKDDYCPRFTHAKSGLRNFASEGHFAEALMCLFAIIYIFP